MAEIMWVISHYGYVALFLLLALGIVGIPIPDETLMVFVGSLTVDGPFSYPEAFLTCMLGSLTGMLFSYTVGCKVGKPILHRYGKWIKLTPARLDRAERWFNKYGTASILIGYFIPGLRHLTCYLAGVSKMKFSTYILTATVGALIWVTTFLTLGHFVGRHWEETLRWLHQQLRSPLVILTFVAIVGVSFLLWQLMKRKRASE